MTGLKKIWVHYPKTERQKFINPDNTKIPITKQCDLLQINRSTYYYQPKVNLEDIALMNKIDEIYTKYPFYGSRKIAKELSRKRKENINRKRIQRLMRIMGIEAVYPKPNLSKNACKQHLKYHYLLKGLDICQVNQVWGTDITYIRLKNDFIYLTAFLDWFSRFVLSWKISKTLNVQFCLQAAEQAIHNYGLPDIENSDQGTQYTSQEYIDLWENNKVAISMDGRGRCMDNIFTERLWRSLKYEEVYLKEYDDISQAKQEIDNYFDFYNHKRLHQSLNYQTPAEVYFRSKR